MRMFREFIDRDKIDALSHDTYNRYKQFLLDRGNSPRTIDIRLTAIPGMITVLEKQDIAPK